TGKERLMSLHGVGHKIADCVLLFSLDKLEAFPVDTWIRKIMQKYYFLKNSSDDSIRSFARSYFGKYAGYAQEYLYYYFRGRI
ncbi:MAG: DNA-3-methyladenine glycosylase 2 family protein, partial [Methanosarcinales archaeon]